MFINQCANWKVFTFSLMRLFINHTTKNKTCEWSQLYFFFSQSSSPIKLTEYLRSLFFWNVAPEMQLWLLSHAHQMAEACNSSRSWPIFLRFKTLWFVSRYILDWSLIISDGGFRSKNAALVCKQRNWFCQNSKDKQMDFIIKNVTIYYQLFLFEKLSHFRVFQFALRKINFIFTF